MDASTANVTASHLSGFPPRITVSTRVFRRFPVMVIPVVRTPSPGAFLRVADSTSTPA